MEITVFNFMRILLNNVARQSDLPFDAAGVDENWFLPIM